MEALYSAVLPPSLIVFFFIFIAALEGHTVVHFGEEMISIMSGTYYIDYSSSVLARTAQLLLTCSAALNEEEADMNLSSSQNIVLSTSTSQKKESSGPTGPKRCQLEVGRRAQSTK